MAEPGKPYTPDALAQRWECTPHHIRRLCRFYGLPHFLIGARQYRIPTQAVDAVEAGRLSLANENDTSGGGTWQATCGWSGTEAPGPRTGEKTDDPDDDLSELLTAAKLNES